LTIEFSDTAIDDLSDAVMAQRMKNRVGYTTATMHPTTADDLDTLIGLQGPIGKPVKFHTLSYRFGTLRVVREDNAPVGQILLT
jgi:hypothetical protein